MGIRSCDSSETLTTEPAEIARVFAAAGDPSRLKLLRFLLDEEHCVSQCTDHIGLTQGAVSKHLQKLAAAGLVTRRIVGRRVYYRVVDPIGMARLLTDVASLEKG